MFTKTVFKLVSVMPIVTLLDITFNPLVILGVWFPIPGIYLAPEYCSTKFVLHTLPHPKPLSGVFFCLPETSCERKFRRYKFTKIGHLLE